VAALARYALEVAEQAAVGLQTGPGEQAGARWLDAEDTTMRQVLAWTMKHDPAMTLRLAVALAPWWLLRGRLAGEYPRLREAAGHAVPGSEAWCAAQFWLGMMGSFSTGLAVALDHFTALRDALAGRGQSRALADALAGRSRALALLGRIAESIEDGRRALLMAGELGYPAGEALALAFLSIAIYYAGDFDGVVRLARQAERIRADIPGWIARISSLELTPGLIETGDLAAAERSGGAALAQSRAAGDLSTQARVLVDLADLDLRAGRFEDAAEHLRESIQAAARTGEPIDMLNGLDWCGYLCAVTGRDAEAVTVWAARAALFSRAESAEPPVTADRRAGPLRRARQALGDARAEAAEERGAAMSPATAAEYALLLTAPGPQPAATPELAGLSARELELVTLVAQGHTNAQIAAKLFISVRTVGSHLDRIRDKTGCRRRADLTRLALTAGLV